MRRRYRANSEAANMAVSPGFKGPPPQDQLQFAIKVLDEDRIIALALRN